MSEIQEIIPYIFIYNLCNVYEMKENSYYRTDSPKIASDVCSRGGALLHIEFYHQDHISITTLHEYRIQTRYLNAS